MKNAQTRQQRHSKQIMLYFKNRKTPDLRPCPLDISDSNKTVIKMTGYWHI